MRPRLNPGIVFVCLTSFLSVSCDTVDRVKSNCDKVKIGVPVTTYEFNERGMPSYGGAAAGDSRPYRCCLCTPAAGIDCCGRTGSEATDCSQVPEFETVMLTGHDFMGRCSSAYGPEAGEAYCTAWVVDNNIVATTFFCAD